MNVESDRPVVTDSHVHIWLPEYIPTALRLSWAEAATYRAGRESRTVEEIFPKVSQDICDPDGRWLSAAMDGAGISKSVIMGVDYGPEEWAATTVPVGTIMRRYDEICRQSAGKLFFAAGVDPRRANAAALAREYLASDVCRGLKIYPPAGFRANEEFCEPLYDALIEADKTAIFHTAISRGRLTWSNSWPIHIADVQARHPGLRIVLAHSGYSCWWDECVALAANHSRTFLELSLWQSEALAPNSAFLPMLEQAVRMCGSNRILFASDTMYGERLTGADKLTQWVQYFATVPELTEGRVSAADIANILAGSAEAAFFSSKLDPP